MHKLFQCLKNVSTEVAFMYLQHLCKAFSFYSEIHPDMFIIFGEICMKGNFPGNTVGCFSISNVFYMHIIILVKQRIIESMIP